MKHIPNMLSVFRIVLIPFFVQQISVGNTVSAGIILVVSAATDMLDGKLARHFGWVTNVGKVLDPVADKLTQTVVSITLMLYLKKYWFFFAFIIFKDFLMLTLGAYLMMKGAKLEGAQWFGKIATVVYYAAVILIVFFPNMPNWVTVTLLSLATACALMSALLYIPEFFRYKEKTQLGEENKVK